MATQANIFLVRLRIKDPEGFIKLLEVATTSLLPVAPAVPASQTAYLVTADGNYYSTDSTAPTLITQYSILKLYISDTTLGLMIDTYGVDGATCKALRSIIASISFEMRGLRGNSAGADKTEYQNLKDIIDVYKYLLSLCTDNKKSNDGNNSGRFLKSTHPTIAGDNL